MVCLKKRIFSLLITIALVFSYTTAISADTHKYTKTDLQSLYDTVANYIFNSEELLASTLTEYEDSICATSILVAKRALLTDTFSPEAYDYIYRGLYNAFSMMSLATQRNNSLTAPKVMRLLKALISLIANDDYYNIVDTETAESVKTTVKKSLEYINNSTAYAQDDMYAQMNQLFITLQSVAEYKIEYFNAEYGIYIFEDIKKDDWFFSAVSYVFGEGLFKGTSNTTFSPGTQMTRGMFITVLSRFASADMFDTTSSYSDVDEEMYYAAPISWAEKSGLITWADTNAFSPDAPITREEMVTTMYNYCKYIAYDLENILPTPQESFSDIGEASEYSVLPLRYAHAMGIISGYEDGSLRPMATATRAEVAQVFINLTNAIG